MITLIPTPFVMPHSNHSQSEPSTVESFSAPYAPPSEYADTGARSILEYNIKVKLNNPDEYSEFHKRQTLNIIHNVLFSSIEELKLAYGIDDLYKFLEIEE